jgi:3-oxoacyl-(acyl-carrier-protein) synthase
LIAAARCAQARTLPSDTAVYFASGRGDLETTVEIMTQLFREGQTPKPLGFVNTVSNAACFYVAQLLGLQSRSNYVCNRYFAFESALQLAVLDLQCGAVTSALVASIDVTTAPVHEHRQRLGLRATAALAEGSHCVWLGPSNAQRPRLGELHCWLGSSNKSYRLAAACSVPVNLLLPRILPRFNLAASWMSCLIIASNVVTTTVTAVP